ncbi:MAG: hypothetical protein AAGD86_00250 [Pseudomonadota bacterium]
MRHAFAAATLAAVGAAPIAAAELPDPESWYREAYAPLWAKDPGDNIERLVGFYAAEVLTHEADGTLSRDARATWLVEPMKQWLAEGWLSAKLTALNTRRINASTATFTARWLDRYAGGDTEVSCGWYLADAVDGRWVFTQYADTNCGLHDFD